MIPAEEALQRLIQGNKRFVAGVSNVDALTVPAKRDQLIERQQPFAIILGCSDSRVPAEMVFDQGLGDLFVVRVAGNVVAPSQLDSIQFSAEQHGAKLVVVLGHSNCAAIQASIAQLGKSEEDRSDNIHSILSRIVPSLEPLYETDLRNQPDELLKQAVKANVRAGVDHLRRGSHKLEELTNHHDLVIVGAEYSLETGIVEFFDGVPAGGQL